MAERRRWAVAQSQQDLENRRRPAAGLRLGLRGRGLRRRAADGLAGRPDRRRRPGGGGVSIQPPLSRDRRRARRRGGGPPRRVFHGHAREAGENGPGARLPAAGPVGRLLYSRSDGLCQGGRRDVQYVFDPGDSPTRGGLTPMPAKLRKLRITRVDLVPLGANPDAHIVLYKAEWSTAFVNNLPDSSFAYIAPGGTKDDEGKTVPRSLRSLPYKDANGKPDAAHVRNALARLSQTDIPASARASAQRKLAAAARSLDIQVGKQDVTVNGNGNGDDDADDEPPMTLEERQQTRQLYNQWGPLWSDFCATVNDIMDYDADDAQYADLLMTSINQFQSQAHGLLDGLGLLAKVAPLLAALPAAVGALQTLMDDVMPRELAEQKKGGAMAPTLEEMTARVAELEQELARFTMTPEEQEQQYIKSLPPA